MTSLVPYCKLVATSVAPVCRNELENKERCDAACKGMKRHTTPLPWRVPLLAPAPRRPPSQTPRAQELVVEKGGHDVIFKVHVDPTGSHLIIGGNQASMTMMMTS